MEETLNLEKPIPRKPTFFERKGIKSLEMEGEKVYLKKDRLGWKVIAPIRNEDDSWNWFNFFTGGKRALVDVIFYIILALLIYFGIKELISNYELIANNPCDFCAPDKLNLDLNFS